MTNYFDIATSQEIAEQFAPDGSTPMQPNEMAFARDVSSRTVFMKDGIIWEEGTPGQIFGTPEKPETKEFLSRFFEH